MANQEKMTAQHVRAKAIKAAAIYHSAEWFGSCSFKDVIETANWMAEYIETGEIND